MGATAYEYGTKEPDKFESQKCCYDDDEDEEDYYYNYPRHPTPPDGGWAWIVMLAAFLCLFTVDGTVITFMPLMPYLVEEFDVSRAKASIIGSAVSGTYLLAGPIVAAMCKKWGNRKVCISGSVLACIGVLMSIHSENVKMMLVTYGVIGGFGLGMVYLPAVVAVGQWFDKKRAFATGFAMVGSGVGVFVFPPLMLWLIDVYRWRGVLYILAGIILNCAVYGMTFIPVERYIAANKPRRPINYKVEINRGDIMTALIESKKRERTISNGSLDNCVITRDNVLIKLDPKLFEGKRNNSLIARFRRQLGFSSQSLASSKNSLQGIPSIVIDAVNKDMNMKAKAAAAAAAANGGSSSLNNSPIYRPSGMTRVQQLSSGSLEKRGSLPLMARGSNPALLSSTRLGNSGNTQSKTAVDTNGVTLFSVRVSKTQSCDVIPINKLSLGSTSSTESENPAMTRSASDLQTHTQFLPFDPADLDSNDLRIQSIQLIPNEASCAHKLAAAKAKGLRCRSSRSESSTHSFGGFSYTGPASAHASSVLFSSSAGSLPQVQAHLEEMEIEESSQSSQRSFPAQCLHILLNMLHYKLLLNPAIALFVFSTFTVVMAMYIPFFYFPTKGQVEGLEVFEAEFLLSIIGITNTIGRILAGWLSDRPWMSPFYLYICSLFSSGLAMLLTPFCSNSTSLSFMAAVFGLTMAVWTSLRPILLVKFLGLDQLGKSFGLLSLVSGVAALIGAPIAGEVMEMTDNVNHCFFMAGGLIILSGLIMLPNKFLKTCQDPVEKMEPVGSPQLAQECGPITETLTVEKLTATSVV